MGAVIQLSKTFKIQIVSLYELRREKSKAKLAFCHVNIIYEMQKN